MDTPTARNHKLTMQCIVSPEAPSSPASAPYGAPAPRSPDACNIKRAGQDRNLLKAQQSSDDHSAAHVLQHARQTPQDALTGVTICNG